MTQQDLQLDNQDGLQGVKGALITFSIIWGTLALITGFVLLGVYGSNQISDGTYQLESIHIYSSSRYDEEAFNREHDTYGDGIADFVKVKGRTLKFYSYPKEGALSSDSLAGYQIGTEFHVEAFHQTLKPTKTLAEYRKEVESYVDSRFAAGRQMSASDSATLKNIIVDEYSESLQGRVNYQQFGPKHYKKLTIYKYDQLGNLMEERIYSPVLYKDAEKLDTSYFHDTKPGNKKH